MFRLPLLTGLLTAALTLPAMAVPITPATTINAAGGLTFSNFSCSHTNNSVFTVGDCSSIDVSAVGNGIAFTGDLAAYANGVFPVANDFVIRYEAQANKDLINSVGLSFNGQVEGNPVFGGASVIESAYADAAYTKLLGVTHVSTNDASSATLTINPAISPLFLVKDISLDNYGRVPGRSDTKISWIDQTFNTVPEPSSLALLGVGLVVVGFVSRRRFV